MSLILKLKNHTTLLDLITYLFDINKTLILKLLNVICPLSFSLLDVRIMLTLKLEMT